MKAHIGVDVRSGVVHSLSATAANVADIAQTHALLHGQEKTGYADAGYTGVEKREEIVTRAADVEWHVAAKRSTVKALPEGLVKDLTQQLEKLKAQVRARVEHPFHVIKNLFHHRKTRYRGLAKNLAQLYSLFALANLIIVRRSLLSAEAE
jgi:IS5 family transposase